METEMLLTFIILIIATIFFIHGRIRSDLIALGSLISLTLTNIITPSEALAGFSNSVVVMIAGLFVVGAGIFNTGLADNIGKHLIKLGGENENRLFVIILLTVGIFSAFMSNTGTVAVLLPVVVSVALTINVSPAKFLMPLAFASSLGGVLTLIGTPPNLVVSQTLAENDYETLHFFQLTPIGIIALLSGTIFLMTIGKKLLPQTGEGLQEQTTSLSPKQLAGIYKVYHSLHLVKVPKHSSIIGKSLDTLDLTTNLGITVVAIEKNNHERLLRLQNNQRLIPKAHTVIEANDVMLVFNAQKNVDQLIDRYELKLLDHTTKDGKETHFLSSSFGITEILVAPQSTFINKTVRELHFRKRLKCTVLAIYRNGRYIQTDVAKERLRAGDALLIHGRWENIEWLAETSTDTVVVGRVSDQAILAAASGKAPMAGLIMLFMLIIMTLELLTPVITVMIAAFLMLITGCLRSTEEAYRKINWESVILIAAMLPMATALEKTGGVLFISNSLIHTLGNYGPYAVLAGFYVLTMTLSQFISNTATAVIFAPIAITTAISIGVSPYPFVISVAVAASMAFATPVASPTNALVMNAGGYTFKDYVKVGVPLQLFLGIIMVVMIPLLYPF